MNNNHFEYEYKERKVSTTETDKNDLADHRVSTFETLGFSKEDAEALSLTNHIDIINGKEYSFPLSWHKVKKMLDAGCTTDLALKILL